MNQVVSDVNIIVGEVDILHHIANEFVGELMTIALRYVGTLTQVLREERVKSFGSDPQTIFHNELDEGDVGELRES